MCHIALDESRECVTIFKSSWIEYGLISFFRANAKIMLYGNTLDCIPKP
jgi:hypothetical protein